MPDMRRTPSFSPAAVLMSCALALLPGCAVGPDFSRPAAPEVADYTAAQQPALNGEDIRSDWWTAFRSAEVDQLVARALKANPNVEAAAAALRAAEENVRAQQGAYYPSLSATVDATRQKTAPLLSPTLASGTNPFSLHTVQVQVSYAPDLFGGNRRAVESLAAQAEFERFQWQAARVSLAANVVAGLVQAASLHDQIDAWQRMVDLQTEQLGLMRRQLELGAIAEAAVVAQEASLAQARAQLPALQKQLSLQNDQLAALAGRLPAEQAAPSLTLMMLHLPEDLPLSLPSRLVEQRPDVRAAEAQLHAASAQIGVAKAARFPQITLGGATGSSATRFADLLTAGSGFWGLAAGLAQPIFAGGALEHRQRAAEAMFDAAAAQYRGTVVAAFQNVADTLEALRWDAEAVRAATAAEDASRRSFELAQRQMALGDISYLLLLASETSYRQAVIARVQAEASRFADTAALFQALGGGWWNLPDEPATAQSGETAQGG